MCTCVVLLSHTHVVHTLCCMCICVVKPHTCCIRCMTLCCMCTLCCVVKPLKKRLVMEVKMYFLLAIILNYNRKCWLFGA